MIILFGLPMGLFAAEPVELDGKKGLEYSWVLERLSKKII